jgi:hypothetical protein
LTFSTEAFDGLNALLRGRVVLLLEHRRRNALSDARVTGDCFRLKVCCHRRSLTSVLRRDRAVGFVELLRFGPRDVFAALFAVADARFDAGSRFPDALSCLTTLMLSPLIDSWGRYETT